MEEKETKKKTFLRSTFSKRVSLFKKRKKSDIRPFIKESKNRQYKSKILNIIWIILLLFSFCGLLWGVRYWILPLIIKSQDSGILSPLDSSLTQENIVGQIKSSGLDIENIEVGNDLSFVTFRLHRQILVMIDPQRGISNSLKLLKEIDSQLAELNKRAIYIDLRYSKPIVKL